MESNMIAIAEKHLISDMSPSHSKPPLPDLDNLRIPRLAFHIDGVIANTMQRIADLRSLHKMEWDWREMKTRLRIGVDSTLYQRLRHVCSLWDDNVEPFEDVDFESMACEIASGYYHATFIG